ncbi:hypothetical protein PAXRUDRAFT_790698 [Paxillus rubicundulus Ve08.2h10]|uniref:Uncharacterized protein n=1 Tax=Paxillus rubicundulus Ve08.2h10 TaxID=930991 RepID=A0A0D0CGK5_9AGAM|nr:hypothetical protein PAXRUDRAFT_790698 [Paxillus rubicundulus Ve08.2h10]
MSFPLPTKKTYTDIPEHHRAWPVFTGCQACQRVVRQASDDTELFFYGSQGGMDFLSYWFVGHDSGGGPLGIDRCDGLPDDRGKDGRGGGEELIGGGSRPGQNTSENGTPGGRKNTGRKVIGQGA